MSCRQTAHRLFQVRWRQSRRTTETQLLPPTRLLVYESQRKGMPVSIYGWVVMKPCLSFCIQIPPRPGHIRARHGWQRSVKLTIASATIMYEKSRNSAALCPYLLNNGECHTRSYPKSHDTYAIQTQQQPVAATRCHHGQKCSYVYNGVCHWLHSEEDRTVVSRARRERVVEMTRGLNDLDMPIQAENLLLDDNFINISQDRDLASFNKVSGGEIAVPGSSLLVFITLSILSLMQRLEQAVRRASLPFRDP